MFRKTPVLCIMFIFLAASFLLASASLAEMPEIEVTGPDSVSVNETVQLEASTTGGIEEEHTWLSYSDAFTVDRETGEVTGHHLGEGKITVFGVNTGVYKSFDFHVDSGKEVTLSLSRQEVYPDESLLGMEIEIDCEIKDTPPEGTKLAAAVAVDDTLYFFPNLTQEGQWFNEDPQVGTHEIIQFPVKNLPENTYTFYAATFDADGNVNSNVAEVVVTTE